MFAIARVRRLLLEWLSVVGQLHEARGVLGYPRVVGRPGRYVLSQALPLLVEEHAIDLVIVNTSHITSDFPTWKESFLETLQSSQLLPPSGKVEFVLLKPETSEIDPKDYCFPEISGFSSLDIGKSFPSKRNKKALYLFPNLFSNVFI